jgi:hypothetical protein
MFIGGQANPQGSQIRMKCGVTKLCYTFTLPDSVTSANTCVADSITEKGFNILWICV